MMVRLFFILAVLFVTASAQAQRGANIIEVPIFTYFECETHGQLKVISRADRGIYDIQYADVLSLIRGTFQYTPRTNGGSVFSYPAYVGAPAHQLGTFRFNANEGVVYLNMVTWTTRCMVAGTFDVNQI